MVIALFIGWGYPHRPYIMIILMRLFVVVISFLGPDMVYDKSMGITRNIYGDILMVGVCCRYIIFGTIGDFYREGVVLERVIIVILERA